MGQEDSTSLIQDGRRYVLSVMVEMRLLPGALLTFARYS